MFPDLASVSALRVTHHFSYVSLPFDHSVEPENGTFIAAGAWCPGKNELQTIRQCSVRLLVPSKLLTCFHRHNLLRSSARLRQIISSTEFTGLFGEAKPHPQGERRNVFGREDELKVAPKGVDKNHPLVPFRRAQMDFRLSFKQGHRPAQVQIFRGGPQVRRRTPKPMERNGPLTCSLYGIESQMT